MTKSCLRLLRQNDPSQTDLYFQLRYTSDEELSKALRANEHVKKITFYFGGNGNTNWNSLLREIAAHKILEKVTLEDHLIALRRIPSDVTNRFLQAIQINPAIQTVRLDYLRLSGTSIASFLESATFVKTFELHNCDMEDSESEQGSMELAAAIQRNTNIRTLKLKWLKDVYLLPILGSLASNTGVKELRICSGGNHSVASTLAIQSLLESTSTLEGFELTLGGINEDKFGPIAQGLINSESVTDVKFDHCLFRDKGSTVLFKSILQSKSNLRSLCICGCKVQQGMFSATDFTNLLRPDSSLRSLEFSELKLDGLFTNDEFASLLGLVEKSKLERFCIGGSSSHEQCQALIACIPKMQVRTLLQFDCEHPENASNGTSV
jgi:hypothetical protein